MAEAVGLSPEFLRSLELFKLGARRSFLGTRQGGHVSPKRGHGIEFSDYRQYELGDNPRHIDWGLFGRTERLYVKRFQEEQDLRVLVALDASASMGAVASDRKWERASEIALALGYIALMSQDSLSIAVMGKAPTPTFHGGRAFHILARSLLGITPSGKGEFARDLQRAAARVRFPGVAVVISDFLVEFDEIERGLNALRAKNLDITVIQVLGLSDREPPVQAGGSMVRDSETNEEVSVRFDAELQEEYAALLEAHSRRIQDFCGGARIGYAQALPEQDLAAWIQNALPAVGLLR